ncbi:MAG: GGDEF domain-containing protein [Pseudomonadota bacterium]
MKTSASSFRQLLSGVLITPLHARWFGAVLLIHGGTALLAKALGWPAPPAGANVWSPMSGAAALSFALAGAALLLHARGDAPALRRLRLALAATLGALNLAIAIAFVVPAFWPGPPAWLPQTGKLPPSTTYALLALAALLAVAERPLQARGARLLQSGTALLGAAGAFGVLGYVMSMDYLYVDAQFARMAFGEAFALCVAGGGLWCVWRDASWNRVDPSQVAVRQIARTSDALLSVIVVGVALIVFGLSQSSEVDAIAAQMEVLAKDRRILFDSVLRLQIEQVEQVRTRPALLAFVRAYVRRKQAQDMSTLAPLRTSAASITGHGFSAFAFVSATGQTMATDGQFAPAATARFPIASQSGAHLLWDSGFVLHTRSPLWDADGLLGYIEAEQRLPDLTQMHADALKLGSSGDLIICASRDDGMLCFPNRTHPAVGIYPAMMKGALLPTIRAIRGETATSVTSDLRGLQVMAAIGPIGTTGLGMTSKMDMWELYAPVRRQFFTAAPFLLLLLAGSIALMRSRLQPLVRALDDARREQAFQARHDPLTGLPNRQLFADHLRQALKRERRSNAPLALLYLDLNKFKAINDTLGHHVGDAVLCWFARHLEASVRATDTVARMGGDEFTIILESMASAADAARIAGNIAQAMAAPGQAMPDARIASVSASIGIALFEPGMDADTLLARADEDMYRNKLAGRSGAHAALPPAHTLEVQT